MCPLERREETREASEPIDKLDHVEIGADGVRPVDSCVGVMQKSVTNPESPVEWNTDTGSQRKLGVPAIVLLLKVCLVSRATPAPRSSTKRPS